MEPVHQPPVLPLTTNRPRTQLLQILVRKRRPWCSSRAQHRISAPPSNSKSTPSSQSFPTKKLHDVVQPTLIFIASPVHQSSRGSQFSCLMYREHHRFGRRSGLHQGTAQVPCAFTCSIMFLNDCQERRVGRLHVWFRGRVGKRQSRCRLEEEDDGSS